MTLSQNETQALIALVTTEWRPLPLNEISAITGKAPVVRSFSLGPGIDFAGTEEASEDGRYKVGDKVVLTGWRVGEMHWGGYAGKARVNAGWLCPLPDGLSTKQAMAVGTAGFTSMLAVQALEDHGLAPGNEGEVLVTGPGGGLGSVAVAILAKLGYRVAAATGRESTHGWLRDLGAAEIVRREELSGPQKRPLLAERWAGCVHAVGGTTLVNALGVLRYGASVAACGLAGGNDLGGTVLPFLLRGVNLLGIDSVMQPYDNRLRIWQRLVENLPMDKLDTLTEEIPLADVPKAANKILKGQVRGRLVVTL